MKDYERPSDQDQSKLGTTWADVEGMIRQRAFPKWAGRSLGVLLALVLGLSVAVGVGYVDLKKYADAKVQNECQALELITQHPIPKPANPAANPSREAAYQFYLAIVYWENRDGCHAYNVNIRIPAR